MYSHLVQLLSEVDGVFTESVDLCLTDTGAILAGKLIEGPESVLGTRRRHCRSVNGGGREGTNAVDKNGIGCDVAANSAKRFGEGAHHDIDVLCVDSEVFGDTSASGPKGTDGVSLIEVEVGAILFLDSDDVAEADSLALHGVHALDDDHDALPGLASPGLARGNGIADGGLQAGCRVVLEDADLGAGRAGADDDGGVIEGVGQDEVAVANKGRDYLGVGGKAHADDDGVLLAQKVGDGALEGANDRGAARGHGDVAGGNARLGQDGADRGVDAAGDLCIAEVVVAAQVEALGDEAGGVGGELAAVLAAAVDGGGDGVRGAGAAGDRGPAALLGALEDVDPGAGAAADGAAPAVLDAEVEAAGVEVLKVGEERGAGVAGAQAVGEGAGAEEAAEGVADVAEDDEDGVAQVGGEGGDVREVGVGRGGGGLARHRWRGGRGERAAGADKC